MLYYKLLMEFKLLSIVQAIVQAIVLIVIIVLIILTQYVQAKGVVIQFLV